MSNPINIKVTVTPKIYVACLAAYNNGKLHGVWIDADQSSESIEDEIQAMLKTSPEPDAEEWAIHDYEGFGGLRLSEWEGIERVARIAAFIKEHGKLGAELISHFGGNLDKSEQAMQETYIGEYKSLTYLAEVFTLETTPNIPETLLDYIDFESIARDMYLNDDVFTIETGFEEVHVFWSR